ncbi:uncharacterized protein LOC135849679 isoform X2 [Planococcus citri]
MVLLTRTERRYYVTSAFIQLLLAVLGTTQNADNSSKSIFPPSTAVWTGPYIGRYDILRLVTSQNPILLKYSNVTHKMTRQELQFYQDHVQINATLARRIFYQTLFQDNIRWKMERQIRITASTAYHLFTYDNESVSKKRTDNEWDIKIGTMAISDRPQTIYMQYGSDHEDVALALLERKIKSQGGCYLRKECGILVNANLPWIGYSPDAIVKTPNHTFLVEVKCPFIGQEKEGIDFLKRVSFFSVNSTTGEVQMRKKHANYAQVQIGMLITNLPLAKMIIYCKKANGIFELDIPFDYEYTENLVAKLRNVYFARYLPFLVKNQRQLWKTNNATLEPVRYYGGNGSTTNHWYKE